MKEAVTVSAFCYFCFLFPLFSRSEMYRIFILFLVYEICSGIFWTQRPAGIKQPLLMQVSWFPKWEWQSCLLRMFPGTSQVLNHAQVLSGRELLSLSPPHFRDHSHSSVEQTFRFQGLEKSLNALQFTWLSHIWLHPVH